MTATKLDELRAMVHKARGLSAKMPFWRGSASGAEAYDAAETAWVEFDTALAAVGEEMERLTKVREIVTLWFAPWGAAKGAEWESLSGDRPFNEIVALELIESALKGPQS